MNQIYQHTHTHTHTHTHNCTDEDVSISPPIDPNVSTNTHEVTDEDEGILNEFQTRMHSIDGGCHTANICLKARQVMGNILEELSISDIFNADQVCEHFTKNTI